MENFVHLHIHTEYSLHDSLLSIPVLLEKAASENMFALAITDFCNLYATIKFYQAAIKAGIKPIIGADLLISDGTNAPPTRIIFLCQHNEGYQNLVKLISKSYLEGQRTDKPLIQLSWLKTYSAGLIALAGSESDIGVAICAQDIAKAETHLTDWQSLFPDRFYIEISRIGHSLEKKYIPEALKLAEKHHVPVVATNAVRFESREDFEAHETRVCIQTGTLLNDPHRARHYTDQQYFRNHNDMQDLFSDIPEALKNTIEIAKRCNVTFTLGKNLLPNFKVPTNHTTDSYLAAVAKEGLKQRLAQLGIDTTQHTLYEDRLSRELAVISKMGFSGYFLIVADFTQWAKDNGIPVGPGRGSGPGSLVAYVLSITDLDPLAFDLLFERFLNPERISMPDFDIDFCVEGRDKVIDYVMDKHGHDSVSQIITYGTMAAKAVVRDVGRVLALGYGFVDKIAKLIPFELGMTLEKALAQEPLLSERYAQEEDVRTLIDLALKLEGLARNVGKHAGGIVIAPGKLTDFVPLYCEPQQSHHPLTQFDKDDVESIGLVKFDFLGLKTLTVIDHALRIIMQPIDIGLISLQDEKTFALLKACQSIAVFQLESHGMRDLIKRLQPDCFEDLIALVALFRPGPLQSGMVDDFINRKQGRAKVIYPHALLEPILRPTYGVILYQEQVMQIAQVLGGFTLGGADILRRAMGKKKPEEMAKLREIFCKGCIERQVNAELANHIFDLMEKFAGYGFNKSHSASYALIAYQTAWLKAHYPAAFMAASLSADMDHTDKIIVLLNECKALRLTVSPPDINTSHYTFTVIDDTHLSYGLGAIKGVGEAAILNMMAAREKAPFKDLFDFCERIDMRKANKRVFDALINAGALDSFGKNRATLVASLPAALQQAEQVSRNKDHGQADLFSMSEETTAITYTETPPWDTTTQLLGEKASLGFYLSGHPVDCFKAELKKFLSADIQTVHAQAAKTARIAGVITNLRTRQTKRGDRFGIFTLEDGVSHIEITCFADKYQQYRALLNEDQMIIVDGEVSFDTFNNSTRIIAQELYTLDQARQRFGKQLRIRLSTFGVDFEPLKKILAPYTGGQCPVILEHQAEGVIFDVKLGSTWFIKPTEALFALLKAQLPVEKIEMIYLK
ncbi:MAG TPA: DNA polymerase III subunit alpha [Gammaproteobacteria bacterium]|jgi:DNA polymerase-3 subunit alpha|nr:DNA polymerase III subunit alpha [Gammaproteobacteria bacterium]